MHKSQPIKSFNVNVYYGQQHIYATSILDSVIPPKEDSDLVKIVNIAKKILADRNTPLFFDNIKVTITRDDTSDVIEYLYFRSSCKPDNFNI